MLRRLAGSLLLVASCAHADTWLEQMTKPDKVGHYSSGATLTAVGSIFASPEVGLAATVVAAIGKEYYDSKHPKTHNVESNDAIATVLGGVLVYAAIKSDKLRVSYYGGDPIINYVIAIK